MATSRMADHVGRVLGGRYRLLAPIGTGASADVFLAADITLRRRVAVKVLHAALAEDEAFLRRFRAEAQQAAALNHPNILRVFDWGESDDGPYLVLEHLAGGSLRDLLDDGHLLSPSQAAAVGLDVARALDYAHRRGLVHRDVKPANLIFDDEGRLCIADFGLARALAEAAWTEPAGAMLGTARYASPEQAQGSSVDGKADVYSLALVLVESVTGRVPFTADTTIATLMARVGAALEPPAELGPLGPVVARAAAPDPVRRPDARELAQALDHAARQLPAPAPLALVGARSAAAVALADHEPHDVTELGTRPEPGRDAEVGPAPGATVLLPAAARRRRRWPAAVLMIVALVVAGAGGAWALARALVPSHPVPTLRGRTADEARRLLARDHLTLRVGARSYDEALADGVVVDQRPRQGKLREGASVAVVVSRGPEPRQIPDLTGLDQGGAQQRLAAVGLAARFVAHNSEDRPRGAVLDWAPRQGPVPRDSEVSVVVSDGPAPREVPDVREKPFEEAAALLARAGLKAARTDAFSDAVEKGRVISSRPAAGAKVARDSTVTLVVSKGPDLVAVPDVVGKEIKEATALIQAAGLQVGGVFGPGKAKRVVLTVPQAGTQVRRGSTIDLYAR